MLNGLLQLAYICNPDTNGTEESVHISEVSLERGSTVQCFLYFSLPRSLHICFYISPPHTLPFFISLTPLFHLLLPPPSLPPQSPGRTEHSGCGPEHTPTDTSDANSVHVHLTSCRPSISDTYPSATVTNGKVSLPELTHTEFRVVYIPWNSRFVSAVLSPRTTCAREK